MSGTGRVFVVDRDGTVCAAKRHNTRWAYARYRCRCPQAIRANGRQKRAWLTRKRAGVARPLPWPYGDDVDEIAVERACRGERLPLNTAERREAVARLTRLRLSAGQIAARTGLGHRSVQRHQAALRRQQAA